MWERKVKNAEIVIAAKIFPRHHIFSIGVEMEKYFKPLQAAVGAGASSSSSNSPFAINSRLAEQAACAARKKRGATHRLRRSQVQKGHRRICQMPLMVLILKRTLWTSKSRPAYPTDL